MSVTVKFENKTWDSWAIYSVMEVGQTITTLLSQKELLEQENEELKSEITDLKSRMQSFSEVLGESTLRKPPNLCQITCDEMEFQKVLQHTKHKNEPRTSSPTDFRSFIKNSFCIDTSDASSPADYSTDFKERILGEIAHQLDRSILSHIFQGQKRFYGFTISNIPSKIIDVSTHPLTGKVDEGYRFHLTQRYNDLMEQLNELGYKTNLHPIFTEFVVNTYGILRDGRQEIRTMKYTNPETLRKIILTTAPLKIREDLLLVLTCLCHMSERNKKPLFCFYRWVVFFLFTLGKIYLFYLKNCILLCVSNLVICVKLSYFHQTWTNKNLNHSTGIKNINVCLYFTTHICVLRSMEDNRIFCL